MSEVGALIRKLRKEAGLTGKALAARISCPTQRISEWELDKRFPTFQQAIALGHCFARDPLDFADPAIAKNRTDPVAVNPSEEPPFRYANPAGVDTRPWPVAFEGESPWYCPHGCAMFGQDFLTRYGLNPMHLKVIEVNDASMAPSLLPGSVCLIDGESTELKDGAVFAVQHTKLLIRRARVENGRVILKADSNSDWIDLIYDPSMVVVGEVVWTARMVGPDRADQSWRLKLVAS